MIHCKNCSNWVDESLDQIAENSGGHHVFMGCKIYGPIERFDRHQDCKDYAENPDLFVLCNTCKITVPRVCLSLGECANCTDTDIFCIESCMGGDNRKYCTHFVRLHTEGIQLINDKNEVFDLFPALGMPERKKES
jgi:hypothetical protein